MTMQLATDGRAHRRSDRPSILLVDDDDALREQLSHELRGAGFAVTAAGDHRHALSVIESVDPLDLLLTDLVMPSGIGGLMLGRMARLRRPRLKLLYFTGYDIAPAARNPGGPVLRKPLMPGDLLAAIDGLLD